MTIYKHELKQGLKALIIWTVFIAFLLAMCLFIFPDLKSETESLGDMFSSMGALTQAFGLDRLSFGTLVGFYSIECGNILGLGGAFYAAMLAVNALSKEEQNGTAEFMLSHPVSRTRIISEKLLAVMTQIIVMNVIVWLIALLSLVIIGEQIPWKEFTLIHLSYLLMQIELAGICFGISAFVRRGGIGIGLGVAVMMYFLNIFKNLDENARFLKYVSAYSYTEGADIVTTGSIDGVLVLVGMIYAAIGVGLAYYKYTKKDIA